MIDAQPIIDVAGEAFNAALEGPGNPTPMDAFEAGAEAATQMMTDMGAPPSMCEQVVSNAKEDYESSITEGMPPSDAFEAIDVEGITPDMGAIAKAAEDAFSDAIDGGSSPADAFEAAAQAAGAECEVQGIPSEMHEAATTDMRADFNEAIENGADPMEAFDGLQPPGMDGGMGAEYETYGGPDPMGAEGEGYAPPPGEGAPMGGGPDGGDYANYDGPPPGADLEGMESLDGALGGGEDYAPPPPDAADAAMDAAMTDSANQDYAPPPPSDSGGGEDFTAPLPPLDSGGGMEDSPPPPDDPGTIG